MTGGRRCNATANPTAAWVCQLVQAFPYDTMPRYLIRDRDGIFGNEVGRFLKDMGIHEALARHDHPGSQLSSGMPRSCCCGKRRIAPQNSSILF